MERKPLHILAKPEEVADRVITAGDPSRVRQLAQYLEDAKLVNENRDFLVYTGKYKGVPVSVAVHGIGAPSATIVFEELIMLGAKLIVRLGSCGGMVEGMSVGDVVIPTGASYGIGGTIWSYAPFDCTVAVPDFDVLKTLIEEAQRAGLNYYVGPIISSDSFYGEGEDFTKKWIERGMIAVEMEAASLFVVGRLRRIKTGALLLVSDTIKEPGKMATAEELKEAVERASRAVFEAVVKIKV
ncbi:MAG: nucleoside phosphorylase [Thermoprotei archaeon]|nr:MAG: nucleoside phosphorylase [Thermoprotei archaeon]